MAVDRWVLPRSVRTDDSRKGPVHEEGEVPALEAWIPQPCRNGHRVDIAARKMTRDSGPYTVAFRGDAHEDPAERTAAAQDAGSPDEVTDVTLPTSLWARFRRAIGRAR